MAHSGVAPLNDCLAIDMALEASAGVGFIVLTGEVEYDAGEFRQWQRDFRLANGKKVRLGRAGEVPAKVETCLPTRHDRGVLPAGQGGPRRRRRPRRIGRDEAGRTAVREAATAEVHDEPGKGSLRPPDDVPGGSLDPLGCGPGRGWLRHKLVGGHDPRRRR